MAMVIVVMLLLSGLTVVPSLTEFWFRNIPFAMISGNYRGMPAGWRLIDCCVGIFGLIPR